MGAGNFFPSSTRFSLEFAVCNSDEDKLEQFEMVSSGRIVAVKNRVF